MYFRTPLASYGSSALIALGESLGSRLSAEREERHVHMLPSLEVARSLFESQAKHADQVMEAGCSPKTSTAMYLSSRQAEAARIDQ